MRNLKVYRDSINQRFIEMAADALRQGHAVIYPTDSLYGIGVSATDGRAIDKLCRLKKLNPEKNTLSIVCDGLSMASNYARIDNRAYRVMKDYLPGPFTFILPASNTLPKVFKERKTVGIRIPDNPIATALVSALDAPLMTTSVYEYDDATDITEPESLALAFANDVALVLDDGHGGSEPSTVVDLTDPTNPVIVRQGVGVFED
jgi:tRNA threonylcarbamoyl adenosine modification protein (Sua5/YciO/YrdC/YwlC family)